MPSICQWPVVALVGLLSLSWWPAAAAQSMPVDCDPNVRPIAGASGYGERIGDPRCEGFFQSPVSATGLEVVSVTLGRVTFDIKTDDQLVISLPNLEELDPEAIRVRAVALPLRMYYRMDTVLSRGQTMHWPVETVIRPWNLTAARLGAFGSVDRDGKRIMIPVAVAPEKGPSTSAGGNVEIKLRSPVRLERLLWREISPDGSVSDWHEVIERPVHDGEVIPFALPAGPPGVVHLDFRAKRANSDQWLDLPLRVWRPGG